MHKKADRQKIIDGYLAQTGRNLFVASEFIDWLAGQPDHECYDLFYSKTDEDAAREWRIQQARRFVSGLRIVVSSEQKKSNVVQITVAEYPAFVSAQSRRKAGGGYEPFNPDDNALLNELHAQGISALRSWLNRYGGAFRVVGHDISAIERLVSEFDDAKLA